MYILNPAQSTGLIGYFGHPLVSYDLNSALYNTLSENCIPVWNNNGVVWNNAFNTTNGWLASGSPIKDFNESSILSMTCWTNSTVSQNNIGVIGDYNTTGGIAFSCVNNEYRADTQNGTSLSTININSGKHHLALILDRPNDLKYLYIDGILQVTDTNSSISQSNASFEIGTTPRFQSPTNNTFNGNIWDIRIYSIDILPILDQIYNNPNGLFTEINNTINLPRHRFGH